MVLNYVLNWINQYYLLSQACPTIVFYNLQHFKGNYFNQIIFEFTYYKTVLIFMA